MKILIAEDDSVSRRIICSAVEHFGHEILSAEDGLEAWDLYQGNQDIDVIISDWMMPGMDGTELCRRVRAFDRPGYTFFIFLTALADRAHLLEGMDAGADEYLTKPLDEDQLRARLLVASRITALSHHLDAGDEGRDNPVGKSFSVMRSTPNVVRSTIRNTRVGGGNVWDILISEGRLTEAQLHAALKEQETNRRELGEVLLSLGYISEVDLARADARRMGLQYIDLSEAEVDRNAITIIDERLSRRHGVMPVALTDETLVLAMSDPTNLYALEDLRAISGLTIVPVVTTESSLRTVQDRLFPATNET